MATGRSRAASCALSSGSESSQRQSDEEHESILPDASGEACQKLWCAVRTPPEAASSANTKMRNPSPGVWRLSAVTSIQYSVSACLQSERRFQTVGIPVQFNGGSHVFFRRPDFRIPLDLRRFPWIRRLAADYAYRFPSPFPGDPADRAAWADAIAETRRAPIDAAPRFGSRHASQQERRQAPPRAREADGSSPTGPHGSPRHRTAGPAPRTALHAAGSVDGVKKLRGASRARSPGPPVTVSGSTPGSRLGRNPLVYRCSIAFAPRSRSSAAAQNRRRSPPFASIDRRRHPSPKSNASWPPPDSAPPSWRGPPRLHAGRRHRPGVRRWLEDVLGPRGLMVYDSSDPPARPARRPGVRAWTVDAGQTVKLAALADPISPRAATTRKCTRRRPPRAVHLNQGRWQPRRSISGQRPRYVSGGGRGACDASNQRPAGFEPKRVARRLSRTLCSRRFLRGRPNELP